MQVIKRDGRVVPFNQVKIHNAICSAMERTEAGMDIDVSFKIGQRIMQKCKKLDRDISVEQIQDMVENSLMASSRKDAAKEYIIYRNNRSMARKNTIDNVIDEIVANSNAYWTTQNSNKDAALATTQRDYIAGAVSTDISKRRILPRDIVEAHEEGIIHFHDMDYFLQPIYNCCLINLNDMLQNGTVISKTKIDRPHKFSTACNIATQIIAQVASSQYGGQSISLAHLSPFVNETRKQYKGLGLTKEQEDKLVKLDIKAGVQTLQYQIITLMTTNGQAPFITVYMNLAEAEEGSDREDLAMVIEEVLKQRITGVKNDAGVYITPAFPKLIYSLDDMNMGKKSKYYYLTELAAKCAAKRLVPDFISNKVQRELKGGDVYPCMGKRKLQLM